MQTSKELIQNVVTIVLAACALIMTGTVVASRVFEVSKPRPVVLKHIANWQALVENRKPVMGDASAPVKIVEFSDFECPACRALETTLKALVKTRPVSVIRYDFPLTDVHKNAYAAAIAAGCAARQGIYEDYQAGLFDMNTNLAKEVWMQTAELAKVGDLKAFAECIAQEQTGSLVHADQDTGRKLGIRVTPTIIINGDLIEGSQRLDTLQKIATDVLNRKS